MITHTEVRDLIGAELLDSSGDKVGKIAQIYLDDATALPEWAMVNTGLLGMNESLVPLAQADRAGHAVRVPYEKSTIKDAPHIQLGDGYLNESQERELYTYYGLDHADQRSDSGVPSGQALGPPKPKTTSRRGALGCDPSGPTADGALPRSEDQVRAGTEKVTAGKARLRKWVETEDVDVKVPVAKQTVPVERVRPTNETEQTEGHVSEQVRKERIATDGDTDLTKSQRTRNR